MHFLSDRLKKPEDFYEIITWDKLSRKSQTTLQRAIERSVVGLHSHSTGFNFDLLSKISIENLRDARFIGPNRAEELIQELISLYDNLSKNKGLDSAASVLSQIISTSSRHILGKLIVDEDLGVYIARINAYESIKPLQRHKLLQELLPSKNPFKRIMSGKIDRDEALGHLIDANLRLSFALAKRVCPDREIRARTVAGNIGLLAGITSFSDKPNIDFESHVMKKIRESIDELIGSHNLSYEDIVALILEDRDQELNTEEKEVKVETQNDFETCATFSELLEKLDEELLKLPRMDQRSLAMLKHRHYAFAEPGLTLDELGKEWGLTRERVRQIVDPLMNVSLQIESEVPILLRAVEIFEECEDEEQFKFKLAETSLFSGEEVSWQWLWGLTRILSPENLANRVFDKHLEMESELEANLPIRSLIKKDRSKFGLYDLQVIAKKYEINPDKAFKIIADIYPRSLRSGSLVLARTKNLDTMFENSIAKQLKVSSPLEVKDLLVGLQRTGKYRDVSLLGSITDLTNLIVVLAGNPPKYEKILDGLIKEVDFQALEKWLIEIFSDVELGILHTNEVVNYALRDKRINVSSIAVYLLNSPIIRSHGRSLYSLVGTEVTKDQLDAYIQVIRGSTEASEVSYEMIDASKGILTVKPNINVITSGIVFPPSGYKEIFEDFKFESFCECGQLDTTQAVKFTSSGFWTGFTAMIRHGFSHHQLSRGSIFRFEFDFDNSKVCLLCSPGTNI